MAQEKLLNSICRARKPDGVRCKAAALVGSDFCYFHDPEKAEERREAQAQGGRQGHLKALPPDTPDVRLDSCASAAGLLSETINQVRKGELDPRVANAVGYLANILLKAIEQSDVERRIEDLEALLKNRTPTEVNG